MISDTLSQAVSEIDAYLSNPVFNSVYIGQTRTEIILLRNQMDTVRRKLDTVPPELVRGVTDDPNT